MCAAPSSSKPRARPEGPMVLPRAFALLRLLSNDQAGMTLSAISDELSVPKSSLSSTLRALVDQGMLARDGQLYRLGGEAFALASMIVAGRGLRQTVRPVLEQICLETGETVLFGVPSGDGRTITYTDFVESPKSIRFAVEVGAKRPYYASACGLVILAYQLIGERETYLNQSYRPALTEKTMTDEFQLHQRLIAIREAGIAVTLGDYSPDAAGFAAPVRDSQGRVIAALSIGVPLTRGERDAATLSEAAKRGASTLSRLLGFRPDAFETLPEGKK